MANRIVYKDNLDPNAGRQLFAVTITDAQVLSIGEAVKLASGKVSTWGTGGSGFGVVVGILKADSSPVTDDGAGGKFTDTYTAPSSNTVQAIIDVSKLSRYTAVADGTVGTTNDSDQIGINIDLTTDSLQLDETSALAVGSTASFVSWGVDPDGQAPANSLIVSIQESQMFL